MKKLFSLQNRGLILRNKCEYLKMDFRKWEGSIMKARFSTIIRAFTGHRIQVDTSLSFIAVILELVY
jgi:hypothetical protein